MLCSERELLLSDNHDGIIELPADTPLGVRYIDYANLNDPVFDIAITPNRPDALGVHSIARDLAARGIGVMKAHSIPNIKPVFPCPITVTTQTPACPIFVGRVIRNVKNTPSPEWLQKRLKAIGLRPINALVDVTNYISYDRARPLHVFDVKKLSGNITVRSAKQNETLLALDETTYTLQDKMTVVCDEAGVQALGGVIGGLSTGCSLDTTDVFIESAYFEPINIAMTGRTLRINSDARYRFERGIDPASCADGLALATQMILEICGGEPSEVVQAGEIPNTRKRIPLDPERVQSLVGMQISKQEQMRILSSLGFGVASGSPIMIDVPSWRPDIHGMADLVEEIVRVASLTKLPAVQLPLADHKTQQTPMQQRQRQVRQTLAKSGLNECITYSFIKESEAKLFGGGQVALKLENPISSEMSDMRPTLLAGLLAAAQRNQSRGLMDLSLFELGAIFTGGEPGQQEDVVTGLYVGQTAPRHWQGGRTAYDVFDAKSGAVDVLSACGVNVENLMIARTAPEWYHPGRSAALKLGPKNTLAVFGELHPKVTKAFKIKGTAVAFTVFLENAPFPKIKSKTRPALELSTLQKVERDFAFVIDETTEVAPLIKAIHSVDKSLISDVTVFDVFSGKKAYEQLGAGKKSVALSVTLQPTKITLTDEDIEKLSERIILAAKTSSAATLRT
jgi:phenylalanyl-tRNA synthetase beta chain